MVNQTLLKFLGAGNRMSLNTLGNRLYLSGLKGTTMFNVGREELDILYGLNPNLKCTSICNYPEDSSMIIQEPNTNDVKLCNQDLSEIKRMKGNFKEGTGNENLFNFFKRIWRV